MHVLDDAALVQPGDVVLIGSPVGTSTRTIDLAAGSGMRGGTVVALTNVEFEDDPATLLEHPSRTRLHELADIVIDVPGPLGDGVFAVEELELRAIPHSGVTGMTAMWMLFSEALRDPARAGHDAASLPVRQRARRPGAQRRPARRVPRDGHRRASARAVNVGLLGYGTIAAEHARALSAEGCRLVAVAGPRAGPAQAFAAEHGVERVAESVEALVAADDVEAVVIASPNALHAEQALLALRHRKHVLCEVPLALSLGDAERVARAADEANVRFLVCQTQRFLAPLRRVREETASPPHPPRHRAAGPQPDEQRRHHRARALLDRRHRLAPRLARARHEPVAARRRRRGGGGAGRRREAAARRSTRRRAADARSGSLATIALSYTAEAPSTDLLVHCDDRSYRCDSGAFRDDFAGAVRRQDAHFLDLDAPPSPAPQELAELYRTLQRVSDLVRDG